MSKGKCPWCEFSKGCGGQPDCDFRSLPYEKEAILARIRKEHKQVLKLKQDIISDEVDYAEKKQIVGRVTDLLAGINIMEARLREDFGMTTEQIREACEFKKQSLTDRARVAFTLEMMKMGRSKK